MSQSLIYTAFSGSSTLQPSNVIPLGSTIRRYGKNLNQSGDGVLVSGCGYYKIEGLINITATTAGNVAVSLQQDGQAIQGGTSSIEVNAPATASASDTNATTKASATLSSYVIPVQAVIRMKCCSEPTTVQMVLDGVAAQVDSTNLIITKL